MDPQAKNEQNESTSEKSTNEMAVTVPTILPSLYDYYTEGGITNGLNVDQEYFKLNNRNITLYSGAMHYFRVPRKYWRQRLRQMRAAGLNTVETYIPWNLHEPEPGKFDFGNGGTDFEDFLHVQEFFEIAKEEDLFAIVRPGPFICAEWEFGGMPSWLLREKNIKVRTSDSKFMEPVARFFNALIPILAALQFSRGGSIIAVQVENEYGSTFNVDTEYLRKLKDLLETNGIVELLTTADGPGPTTGSLPELFKTVNFNFNPEQVFNQLRELQPGKPIMAMEYWDGWFDHWGESHHVRSAEDVGEDFDKMLAFPGSVNFYMFHGGTSFGFMNGGNMAKYDNENYIPDTTSYDYDAPLNEAGDYTKKYDIIAQVIAKYNKIPTYLPPRPENIPKTVYPTLKISQVLDFDSLLQTLPMVKSHTLMAMEDLPINGNAGQSYGYIVYQKSNIDIDKNSILTVMGRVCDILIVRINGVLITKPLLSKNQFTDFGFWNHKNGKLTIRNEYKNATLDLIVENWGRNNFGNNLREAFNQRKGLWQGDVLLNDQVLNDWTIYPLEFRSKWTRSLQNWKDISYEEIKSRIGPSLYKTEVEISNPDSDTYLDLKGWIKGIVIVNGFVLGRYSTLGPQHFLYLPAPLLRSGKNEILLFEHYVASSELNFSRSQIFNSIVEVQRG